MSDELDEDELTDEDVDPFGSGSDEEDSEDEEDIEDDGWQREDESDETEIETDSEESEATSEGKSLGTTDGEKTKIIPPVEQPIPDYAQGPGGIDLRKVYPKS
jgi:hypothetical protein